MCAHKGVELLGCTRGLEARDLGVTVDREFAVGSVVDRTLHQHDAALFERGVQHVAEVVVGSNAYAARAEGLGERDEVGVAVAPQGERLARGLAVHVDAHE